MESTVINTTTSCWCILKHDDMVFKCTKNFVFSSQLYVHLMFFFFKLSNACPYWVKLYMLSSLLPLVFLSDVKLIWTCMFIFSFPFMHIIFWVNISYLFSFSINFFLYRCNLAPVVEFAADVGTKSDFITMNPSVVQRAFGGFRNENDREKFVHRLSMLNDSVLWIPAFMVKGGEKHVEWVNALILKNKLKVRTAYPSLRLIHAVRG